MAIDDVVVTKGGCPATPQCDPVSQLKCFDRCLNMSQRCDRVVDCFDMSDEMSCDWTADCDFTSDCNSYVITFRVGVYVWKRRSIGVCCILYSNLLVLLLYLLCCCLFSNKITPPTKIAIIQLTYIL